MHFVWCWCFVRFGLTLGLLESCRYRLRVTFTRGLFGTGVTERKTSMTTYDNHREIRRFDASSQDDEFCGGCLFSPCLRSTAPLKQLIVLWLSRVHRTRIRSDLDGFGYWFVWCAAAYNPEFDRSPAALLFSKWMMIEGTSTFATNGSGKCKIYSFWHDDRSRKKCKGKPARGSSTNWIIKPIGKVNETLSHQKKKKKRGVGLEPQMCHRDETDRLKSGS